ncbi:MAG: formate acetyltransferase [Candidatus Freyarchaeota archaeon]|nr:formate acetyltransferase [Candidatus Jordarchaeia archaeon]MBS7267699.1 formate acetyltransferase [Candidatus Jordarchaeia archaeon]MBS7278833.1 formate acetyltransferase [Candidatus Jordarchaeia archaeon]
MNALKELKSNFSIGMFKLSLRLMGLLFRISPKLRKEVYNKETGFIFNAKYQFKTRDGKVNIYVVFKDGKMKVSDGVIDNPNITIYYKDKETMAKIWNKSPEESLNYLLTNEMNYVGNMAYLTKFSYMTTVIKGAKIKGYKGPGNRLLYPIGDIDKEKRKRLQNEILGRKVDNVKFLEDPYLGKYSIDDFPRLKYLKNRRYALKPAICVERAKLLTEYHRENGFEVDKNGKPIDPELRQAKALYHILTNRKPIIHDQYLIPGSTTTKEVGIPIYPELIGTAIWPELRTIYKRELNPNDISPQDADILNFEVFPYWMDRNVREYCRQKYGNPISQQLEERFVLYFMMKNNAISHTVPGLPKVLTLGFEKIREEAAQKEKEAKSPEKKNFYKAVQIVIDGVLNHAKNLSKEALRIAETLDPNDPQQARRIEELKEISRICAKVPAKPAETMHEALTSLWITWTCIHSENANSAMSIGRLDQMLQPYFEKEMSQAKTDKEREEIIKRAIELVGHFFLRINDHDPLVPSVGNKLFGGSSSDDTVTVGGVDREGKNAVNDMTYIILKVAEMLCFQDPNMNARYYTGINSKEYLRRLCEVNINMVASPSIHNDKAMIEALVHQGIPIEDARDWAATGCVEPTIVGKHFGHTNCMLLNLVAPLEMALNNGVHPVMGEKIGPETGDVRNSFDTFEDFLNAYKTQLRYLAEKSIEINNYLGYAHQYIHPTPLLSSLFEGCLEKGTDVVNGGAIYNTSGVALVSLTDVVDSLLVIRDLIYKKKVLDWPTLMNALENNFENGTEEVLRKIQKVPKFGSDEPGTNEVAQDLIDYCFDLYNPAKNYRGGNYLVGYWSISYHVGFGMLSGALPSGRKKGKAFTPGLTPAPGPSDQLLQNIRSIASMNYLKMPNNASYNVKLVPHSGDSHKKTLDLFTSYVQSFFDLGGMQWQFNVITSDTLRDAMKNPDDYRWLLVRVSGYNAYFVKLNKNMQQEIIERTEFCAR